MTVGIVFTNGLEAVVMADEMGSTSVRQSNQYNKMGFFNRENYFGVLVGAGGGNLLFNLFARAEDIPGIDFKDYVENMQLDVSSEKFETILRISLAKLDETQAISAVCSDSEEKKDFIEQLEEGALEEISDYQDETNTDFVVVGYDREKGCIRSFTFDDYRVTELKLNPFVIGSGLDGAGFHMTAALQGIDKSELSLPQLIFFAMNAYSLADINTGVGGMPKIAIIDGEGIDSLNLEKKTALGNLSGAFLARYWDVSETRMIDYMAEIITGDSSSYPEIAENLNVTVDTLTSKYIPYSTWQEASNRKIFS